MTVTELLGYVRDGGLITMLILVLIGGWRRYWVFGWYAEELRIEIAKLRAESAEATRESMRQAEAALAEAERAKSLLDALMRGQPVPRTGGER